MKEYENFPMHTSGQDMIPARGAQELYAHGAQQCFGPREAAHTVQDGAE